MRTVKFWAFIIQLLGSVLHASAANCVNNQDMLASACVCVAGFRVDEKLFCETGATPCDILWRYCLVCPSGTYSVAGDTSCAPCATGTHSHAGAATCTVDSSNKTTSDDAVVETILERIDALVAGNQVYVNEITSDYLASHAPALYAISVIGFVGALLNSVAICLVILWVRSIKSAVTQIDTTMP